MNEPAGGNDKARCLRCGHAFLTAELAAMTARKRRDDLCIVECAKCRALNEVRSEPQQGLDEQPALVVRRIVVERAAAPGVFLKSVD